MWYQKFVLPQGLSCFFFLLELMGWCQYGISLPRPGDRLILNFSSLQFPVSYFPRSAMASWHAVHYQLAQSGAEHSIGASPENSDDRPGSQESSAWQTFHPEFHAISCASHRVLVHR